LEDSPNPNVELGFCWKQFLPSESIGLVRCSGGALRAIRPSTSSSPSTGSHYPRFQGEQSDTPQERLDDKEDEAAGFCSTGTKTGYSGIRAQ
jgi:hypothetical protein